MRPNEIIGFTALATMTAVMVYHFIYGANFWMLLEVGASSLISNIFLSYWGLTTFNEWIKSFEKKYEKESDRIADLDCPACGYYCSDKGGVGCIYKKSMFEMALKNEI